MIRELRLEDAEACDAVLATLPYHFGDPDGIRDCHAAVRSQRGFVAEQDGRIVGFMTLHPSSDDVTEITWLAVRNDKRRGGIGRALIEAAGDVFLCVMTLGPSVPEEPGDNYEGTREFYRRMGFVPVKELQPRTWNSGAALLLVRPPA